MSRVVIAQIEFGLLCAWIGAALLVAAAVAPAAFAVLPTRTLAGALVGRVLPVVFWSGLVVSSGAALLEWSARGWPAAIAPLVAALSCAVAQFVIAPRIERVRAAIAGPVDALAATDPQRIAFGRLHMMSVLWMGVAMLAAAVAAVLIARDAVTR